MDGQATSPLGTLGPESLIARYRHWFDHERFANDKMLGMMESVPEAARTEAKFLRTIELAGHLAACRENHLENLLGQEVTASWWPKDETLESLRARYARLEAAWSAYLNGLSDATLVDNYVIKDGEYRFLWNIEGQVFQLIGHAHYHRGQISLIVEELGGVTVDTDYVDWAYDRDGRFYQIIQ